VAFIEEGVEEVSNVQSLGRGVDCLRAQEFLFKGGAAWRRAPFLK
jgi:hypothetical protein